MDRKIYFNINLIEKTEEMSDKNIFSSISIRPTSYSDSLDTELSLCKVDLVEIDEKSVNDLLLSLISSIF